MATVQKITVTILCSIIIVHSYQLDQFQCPNPCTCSDDFAHVQCNSGRGDILEELSNILNPNLRSLQLSNYNIPQLELGDFGNASNLQTLSVTKCQVQNIVLTGEQNSEENEPQLPIDRLDLSQNKLKDNSIIYRILSNFNNLEKLNLSHNQFGQEESSTPKNVSVSEEVVDRSALRVFDLSHNLLKSLLFPLPLSVKEMHISHNFFNSIEFQKLPANLEILDISHNSIDNLTSADFSSIRNLLSLDLSGNPFSSVPMLDELRKLTVLKFENTKIEILELAKLSKLKTLDKLYFAKNEQLTSIVGTLSAIPKVSYFDLSRCNLRCFSNDIFSTSRKVSIALSGNPLNCANCQLLWKKSMSPLVKLIDQNSTQCMEPNKRKGHNLSEYTSHGSCLVGIDRLNETKHRAMIFSKTIIYCDAYGDPPPIIEWSMVYPKNFVVGTWKGASETKLVHDPTEFDILPGGYLVIKSLVRGKTLGDYECRVENNNGNASVIVEVRLDFSYWFMEVKIYSVLCGIAVTVGFLIINVLWAIIRHIVLWRISQMEKTSRVRKMLEAMEKYRQRQVESLHEKYTTKIGNIRDNYNCQAEQLRRSYGAQTERFSNYKAQQMESVTHHIDSVRDNYNSQMGRMRDYGSRQLERLWENYQRQMNRIRTFSLQQRLRIMRQYKIKQRYLNVLLDSLYADAVSPEGEVRVNGELMTMPSLVEDEDDDDPLQLSVRSLRGFVSGQEDSFSISTYHSLPAEIEMETIERDPLEPDDRPASALPATHIATKSQETAASMV